MEEVGDEAGIDHQQNLRSLARRPKSGVAGQQSAAGHRSLICLRGFHELSLAADVHNMARAVMHNRRHGNTELQNFRFLGDVSVGPLAERRARAKSRLPLPVSTLRE